MVATVSDYLLHPVDETVLYQCIGLGEVDVASLWYSELDL